jgi:hypothetical protein
MIKSSKFESLNRDDDELVLLVDEVVSVVEVVEVVGTGDVYTVAKKKEEFINSLLLLSNINILKKKKKNFFFFFTYELFQMVLFQMVQKLQIYH